MDILAVNSAEESGISEKVSVFGSHPAQVEGSVQCLAGSLDRLAHRDMPSTQGIQTFYGDCHRWLERGVGYPMSAQASGNGLAFASHLVEVQHPLYAFRSSGLQRRFDLMALKRNSGNPAHMGA
ncbi:MAG: hypothetical protein ACTS6J_07835 [Burkholderiales bacterium]